MTEVDEIQTEDLEAASDMYDDIVRKVTPTCNAIRIAKEQHGIEVLPPASLDRILGQFACTQLTIEECVTNEAKRMKKTKPYSVCVKLEIYYDVDPSTLPSFVHKTQGSQVAAKIFEEVSDNSGGIKTLADLGIEGVWKMNPVEICVDSITEA